MSHRKERSEKNCLNCGTIVAGRFCQACGQENVEPKETAWHIIEHFFSDITHFDGKFFQSVWLLFKKPGFLSKQYMLGKRADYLNPIRMYVFTSALFFLIFFSTFNAREMTRNIDKSAQIITDSLKASSARAEADVDLDLDSLQPGNRSDSLLVLDSSEQNFLNKVKSVQEYDSMQATLAPGKRDGWLKRLIIYRSIKLKHEFTENRKELVSELIDHFLHTLPYILFLSLPLYALFLKLLYVRHKEYYYADHGIFLVHLYIFTFLFFLVLIGLSKLQQAGNIPGMGWIYGLLFILGIYYAYKAMRNFYQQGSTKTLVKFTLFNFLCINSIGLLFLLSLMVSVLRI